MERGVEAGNLGQRRTHGHQHPDAFQAVRLVQRREWRQPIERRDHRGREAHGRGEVAPAVHHPVPYRGDSFATEVVAQTATQMCVNPSQQPRQNTVMAASRIAPALVRQYCASGVFRGEVRRAANRFNLAF